MSVITIRSYIDARGHDHFASWRANLDPSVRVRIDIAVTKLGEGNFSAVKPERAGVSALRLDFGPGYRVYLGQDGKTFVLLLAGGTKKRQQRDIDLAVSLWAEYKQERKEKK
jgi:putative addiction module killer protein